MKKRILSGCICAMLLLCGFTTTAFAGGGEGLGEVEITTGGYEPESLTPEGNMSLVDDIEGDSAEDKQFITVVTRNGNYFYIIIDHAEDGENTVHFLNQVDERDLLSLMEDEAVEELTAVCSCSDRCVAGAVNTSCAICKTNMTECMGKEAEPETQTEDDTTDTPVADTDQSGSGTGILLLAVVGVLVAGGAGYYFKVYRPKRLAADEGDEYEDGSQWENEANYDDSPPWDDEPEDEE